MPCKLMLAARDDVFLKIDSPLRDRELKLNTATRWVSETDATVIDAMPDAVIIAQDFNRKTEEAFQVRVMIYDIDLHISPDKLEAFGKLMLDNETHALACHLRCEHCERKISAGIKSLKAEKQNHKLEGTEGMSETTVKLNERNTARLLKVAGLLECDTETFLNEFLMSGLEDPCAAVECMDFTEGGTVGRRAAERARQRVRAAARVLAQDAWEVEANGEA